MFCEIGILIIVIYSILILIYTLKEDNLTPITILYNFFVLPFNLIMKLNKNTKLTKKQQEQLTRIEKKSYFEKAKELSKKRGEDKAKEDFK